MIGGSALCFGPPAYEHSRAWPHAGSRERGRVSRRVQRVVVDVDVIVDVDVHDHVNVEGNEPT